jgi:hypothetical protein
VDKLSLADVPGEGLDAGFDLEDGAFGGGLELAEEACAEAGVEFGADGGGVEGDGEDAFGEAEEAGFVAEVRGNKGLPEVGDAVEFFGGFVDDFFEPGEEDVAEFCGGACFGVSFVGEEGFEGEDLEAVAFHFEVDNLCGRRGLGGLFLAG